MISGMLGVLLFFLTAAQAAPKATTRDKAPIDLPALAGFSLRPAEEEIRVVRILPKTAAARMGLEAGDALLYLNGSKISSRPDAAAAISRWKPGTRLSAVVRRGFRVLRLSSNPPKNAGAWERSSELTMLESAIRDQHLTDTKKGERVSAPQGEGFTVAAGGRIWINFPKGIPHSASVGEILEGVTSTSMSTDANLDFIAVAQESKVWAQVVSVAEDDDALVRMVRLHIFKIQLKGGKTYGCSAVPIKVSGRQAMLKVSRGGTIVSAVRDGASLMADADRNFQIEFLRPWTIYEPAEYYATGPGLWLKSRTKSGKKWFEVTHVIPNRSADRSGLKPGDLIFRINGAPAQRLSFPEAIRSLYGEAGTDVKIDIRKAEGGSLNKIRLTRGRLYRRAIGLRARRIGEGVIVTNVLKDSPAAGAGLKKGDALLRIGDVELKNLTRAQLRKALQQNLSGENKLTYARKSEKPRTVELTQDWIETDLTFSASARPRETATKASKRPSDVPRKRRGR